MRQYTKNWISAFTISVLVCICFILAFMLYFNMNTSEKEQPERDNQELNESERNQQFVDIDDNVGAVSFTEDQITELARNIFSLDGFLNNVSVELETQENIKVNAKIKDKEALIEHYPELEKYSVILSAVENREIEITGGLENNDGLAAFAVDSVKVSGMPIDKNIISPFIEQDDFSQLFNVDYDSIEVDSGMLVFKDGLPAILQY